jgi:hypothetical protein
MVKHHHRRENQYWQSYFYPSEDSLREDLDINSNGNNQMFDTIGTPKSGLYMQK